MGTLTAPKLRSDRDQKVALAFWHARRVLGILARIGELQDKQNPDTDYRLALFAQLELIAHGLDKNLPLSDDARELLESLNRNFFAEDRKQTRPRGRGTNENEIRDRWIAGMVDLIVDKCGLDATRGQASRDKGTNVSACRVVAKVLPELLGNKALAERRVEDIWRKCRKRKTAYNVLETFAGALRLGELGLRAVELHNAYLRKEN
jgi:hypothetical protein